MDVRILRCLVVDDEPRMRSGIERTLMGLAVRLDDVRQEIRFEVAQAGSAEEALTLIEERPPDLMLLDLKLPGMSGIELLEQLDRRRGGMVTIMITAYATLETAVSATKHGAYDFLAKPFTPEEVRSLVRKATRHLMLQREARRLAEERRKVRFEFISVLAHELKAPIAAIEGYLELLKEESGPAARGKMIDRSLVRLDGMRKLIFDLLDMTRIESGLKIRSITEIDLREIVDRTVETFVPEALERGISIEVHGPPRVSLWADRSELEIVANNLVSNAVKYNRTGGSVTVNLLDQGEAVALEVADTGIGMTAEEQGRLFGDFVRIRNEKTRNVLGSGLGLSTVRKLAQLYGGDVEVRSVPDEGSTFRLVLRRAAAANDAGLSDRAVAHA